MNGIDIHGRIGSLAAWMRRAARPARKAKTNVPHIASANPTAIAVTMIHVFPTVLW
jgi:hypothetical protein